MKRHQSITLLIAGAALLAISGYAQEIQTKQTLEQRVEELEKELELTKVTLAGISDSATESAAELDAITKYLQQQSAAAAKMVSTLATSESQGFVAGINFPSRETMLAGWRAQLAAAQNSVPGTPAPVVEKSDPFSRRGQR